MRSKNGAVPAVSGSPVLVDSPEAEHVQEHSLTEDCGNNVSMDSTSLPQGLRVTAAGIRLSTWMVQKVDTLKWFLTGIVNPDDDFDSTKRSGRSRAVRWCLDIS